MRYIKKIVTCNRAMKEKKKDETATATSRNKKGARDLNLRKQSIIERGERRKVYDT